MPPLCSDASGAETQDPESDPPVPVACLGDFRDPSLAQRALTHRSAGSGHNERLEFLGDAVLGLVVAEHLLGSSTEEVPEGELTLLRSRLVSRSTLARVARRIGLGPRLRLGAGELRTGGMEKDRILCGALEAVVGAAFLDRGYPAARDLVLELLCPELEDPDSDPPGKDPKNLLQEALQAIGHPLPSYEAVSEEGEPHRRVFTVRVRAGHLTATATGSSKRTAERAAARELLRLSSRFPFEASKGDGGTP